MPTPEERFREVLRTEGGTRGLYVLAESLRDEGQTQVQVYALFDSFRAEHQDDADETVYDSILDAMDCVSGHCRPEDAIFKGPSQIR
jgi:hypothetical protein